MMPFSILEGELQSRWSEESEICFQDVKSVLNIVDKRTTDYEENLIKLILPVEMDLLGNLRLRPLLFLYGLTVFFFKCLPLSGD